MTETDTNERARIRLLGWSAPAVLILLPLIAMKTADPTAWEFEDLPFAFVMIAAIGLAFEFALRIPAPWAFRAGSVLAIGTALLLTWGNLAVGFAGSEDNAINLIFFAVPAIALAGSLTVRFKPRGLADAMTVTAAAQLAAGMIAYYNGHFTGPLTIAFTGMWLAASLSFRRSSEATGEFRNAA